MVHFPVSMLRGQCPVIQFAVIGALVSPLVVLAPRPAQANDFATCSTALVEAGVKAETAAIACARALHPDRVSRCVVDITDRTDLDPDQALVACSRDRRPAELATCVTTIHDQLEVSNSAAVLDNCRRSPLPLRYSDCVVGLASELALPPTESMATCTAAGYRPEDVAPTFIYTQ